MAQTVTNVGVGKPKVTGGVYRAPLGTALPTDESVALNAAFVGLGYAGEDGVVFNPERSTDKRKAWGGSIVKVLQTDYSETWTVTLIEYRNPDVQRAVFGESNVTVTAATATEGTKIAVKHNSKMLEFGSWSFDMLDGIGTNRTVLPNAQVTTVGEVTYSDEEIIAYALTLEAFEDEAGNNSYEYIDDGVIDAP